MQHHFNTEIAKKYDIITAVILDNFYYWIEKNRVNDRHFHEDRYWTYNTKKALAELFPYLTERQIDYAIKKMVENNLIMTGNYNENKYDRTLWYAITDFGYSILQNCEMYNIYTITNTNTNIKENKKESVENLTLPLDSIKSLKPRSVTKEDVTRWFETIYALYPRKVNKVKAKKAFEKKIIGLEYEKAKNTAAQIYKMLKAQLAVWGKEHENQGRGVEFIPYFSSWINGNVEDSVKKGARK